MEQQGHKTVLSRGVSGQWTHENCQYAVKAW